MSDRFISLTGVDPACILLHVKADALTLVMGSLA